VAGVVSGDLLEVSTDSTGGADLAECSIAPNRLSGRRFDLGTDVIGLAREDAVIIVSGPFQHIPQELVYMRHPSARKGVVS
jgi:hypothetical protein